MTESEHTADAEMVTATIKQTEGKLTMSETGERRLRVSSPRCEPLSKIETVATIEVAGNESTVFLQLDSYALDHLIDELYAVQQGEVFK
jgi:hypothetical protein